jgi:hypothetical protein
MAGLWPQRLPPDFALSAASIRATSDAPGREKHGVHLGAGKGLRTRPGFVKGSSKSREIEQNLRN